ncbi:hypothetical protein [Roseiterribacter gracilis]|uniref:OmpA-like domain-containing protein n=1 Tax=Roseiterribacter gracilis TaxID=2812848 RepID=A0A8S8XKE8_9PROT|nr:hypothetical protein TMPK1_38430 [Rhodospirillales bacterium TMPK1]
MRVLALLLAFAVTGAQAETVRFITCPIYRDADAGKKSGCWLADDRATGKRYDVSQAPSKPDWNREVLVEGTIAQGGKEICGGIVLEPVRTSILPGACTRQMLPAENFTGRKFVLPKRNISPLSVKRDPPPPPYAARSFHLFFDFGQAFVIYQYDDYLLDEAVHWIRAAKPRAITVTGYAATSPAIVSGRTIAEDAAIARVRAAKIGEALVRLGIDRKIVTVKWQRDAAPIDVPEADGLAEASRRRVDIAVAF